VKNIDLKTGRNIRIVTPNGCIVIGVDTPYNADPETYVYFTDHKRHASKTENLTDLLKVHAQEDSVETSSFPCTPSAVRP
jgi:hypothetical protein